jgi:hypothetical protein
MALAGIAETYATLLRVFGGAGLTAAVAAAAEQPHEEPAGRVGAMLPA